MFGKWRHKPLTLELGERTVSFESVGDFEFSLSSRTDVPAAKVAELVRLDASALEREAASIREVQRHFVEVLARSLESPGSLGYLVSEMDSKLFSQDHDWREIMRAVNQQGREFEEFKKIALVKYMQYLGSRQDVLQSIYANKHSDVAPGDQEPDDGQAALRETLIFDVRAPQDAQSSPRYARLPRGETVPARLAADGTLEMILSRHALLLTGGEKPIIRDEHGREHVIERGRALIGRQPDCDFVMDSRYRDVSRQHLMLDLRGLFVVELTDLSSHGTFVPSEALDGQEPAT